MGEDPKSQSFAERLLRWLTPLCGAWLWVRERAYALKPCRSAIILVFAGLAFLLLADQGEDVARALAERRTDERFSTQGFRFFAAGLGWPHSARSSARVLLAAQPAGA